MSYSPKNANGQATMANSEPVVIASDQSAVPVSAASLPLPTGASTSAKQDTIIGHVDGIEGLLTTIDADTGSIDSKTPALGQALAAASVPVVLPAAQITTLTPPAAITGFATSAAQTDKSQFTKLTDGTDTALVTAAGELNVIATAQPGVDIGDVTINNASGAAAVNIQDGGNSITVDGTVAVSGTVAVTDNAGSLTVDAPVATPVFVRLSDGAAAITALPITDNAGSLTVDYATTGNGTAAGALRVALPTDGTGVVGLIAGSAIVGKVGIDQTTPGTTNRVDVGTINSVAPAFGSGVRGATVQRVTIATDDIVPASQSGTWTVQPGNTANTTPWLITDTPATTGGLSTFHLVGAATDNATNVKASAGQVYSITAFNLSASPRYLKFHNTAGTPTAGSGVVRTVLIPGNTAGAGAVINIDKGLAFSTGIGISIVAGIADSNTTAIGASEVVVDIGYK